MAPEDGYGGIELAKGIKSLQISFAFELFIIKSCNCSLHLELVKIIIL